MKEHLKHKSTKNERHYNTVYTLNVSLKYIQNARSYQTAPVLLLLRTRFTKNLKYFYPKFVLSN